MSASGVKWSATYRHWGQPSYSCCCQIVDRWGDANDSQQQTKVERAHGVRFGGTERSRANWRSVLARDAACAYCTAPHDNNSTAATTSTSLLPAISAIDASVDDLLLKEAIKLTLVMLWVAGV